MSETVLITGANRGIGLSLVKQYLSRGDKVIGVCRTTSAELSASGADVIEGVDVSKDTGIGLLVEAMNGRQIDVLINNAGILLGTSFDELDFDAVLTQFEVNAVAPLRVVVALSDCLKRGSKVAMITSRMGSIEDNSSGGSYGYRMSKTALNAAGKSLALDLKARGIAVALIHPGWVNTEMVNFNGLIEPEEAAEGIVTRIDELNLESTGGFWHSNGEPLPW
ncbi:SDR family oxidoreductase [Aliikangiella sp. G2MR2-5]|uniref:SDR family oxidoreductase n=1 Tax=Aliikangiella sp. G2MR2-5 TaxID=2788943 RepID=UPI0018AA405F|nr:SDR family oxidoreductase [Aliikangiella sp. G2MR2-5]